MSGPFAIHARGASPDAKVFRYRSARTGEVTEFVPERGMVTIQGAHYKTGEEYFHRESRREFLVRALALSHEVKVCAHADERRELQRLVEMMVEVAKRAHEQGDPFIPEHVRDVNRGRPRQCLPMTYEVGAAGPVPAAPADKPMTPTVAPDGPRIVFPAR